MPKSNSILKEITLKHCSLPVTEVRGDSIPSKGIKVGLERQAVDRNKADN